jgi:hypothetical protein
MRLARREHAEGKQEKCLAQNGKGHVYAAGPLRRRRLIEREHAIGRDTDQRVDQIEGQ